MTPITFIATVPLEEWRYAWRLAQLDRPMPDQDRKRIRPLAPVSAKELSERLDFIGLHLDFPFKKGLFNRIDSLPLDDRDAIPEEDRKVEQWLSERNVPLNTLVFLDYDGSNVVVTDWEMVLRYWRMFYYPVADDLTVFEDPSIWCLLFFHEHEIFFGTNQKDSP